MHCNRCGDIRILKTEKPLRPVVRDKHEDGVLWATVDSLSRPVSCEVRILVIWPLLGPISCRGLSLKNPEEILCRLTPVSAVQRDTMVNLVRERR